ncbi:hypothetical protein [Cimodo virus]|uniref:hypothetical protein n=1 Tax=Cimodo virus TaxID=1427476 RepID=UPI0003E76548|nr:hypothetical protein [Cimodo virus]AHF20714.1 hypothetical protein [Cimodo virus]AHF20726.1 hypothetical protein [Cimodo virus]
MTTPVCPAVRPEQQTECVKYLDAIVAQNAEVRSVAISYHNPTSPQYWTANLNGSPDIQNPFNPVLANQPNVLAYFKKAMGMTVILEDVRFVYIFIDGSPTPIWQCDFRPTIFVQREDEQAAPQQQYVARGQLSIAGLKKF